ncbi:general substrate transporter [Penicillium canariense]|uniref:General substrate transporter n=1 Tax=Penicillium canariense TaxID=189055 RepID=A0A9W9LIU1_9EURO|nr:general substrate transporter [Penicillium canariense]KAJ5157844.1 general substrate transporter [Penicillium canariense]
MAILVCGRLIVAVPVHASEMAEASTLGMLFGLLQWMLSWGGLVAQWLGDGCSLLRLPLNVNIRFE